jgi:hypothetical protein
MYNNKMARRKYYILAGILLFLAAINFLLFVASPRDIVASIGVENTYIIVFAIAAIGGLSSVTGAAFYASVITFAGGGANPLLLTLAGGAGIFISDTIFYYLALYGWQSVPKWWESKVQRIREWIEKRPQSKVATAVYIYIGFTPLPNDLLMLGLVIGGYAYRQIFWPLLAGSFTIAAITAYLGEALLSWIR